MERAAAASNCCPTCRSTVNASQQGSYINPHTRRVTVNRVREIAPATPVTTWPPMPQEMLRRLADSRVESLMSWLINDAEIFREVDSYENRSTGIYTYNYDLDLTV